MEILRAILYMAALGIASHIVGQALPRSWFHYDRFPYRGYAWERGGAVYERLHIRSWKKRLPDMSRIMRYMVPKRVEQQMGAAEMDILIRETCVAEIVHVVLCLLSPTIYHFCRNLVGVLFSAIFAFGNLPFILIQRYNRPKLVHLMKRLEKREGRGEHAHTDPVG